MGRWRGSSTRTTEPWPDLFLHLTKIIRCGNFIGIDKLERLILLQRDPLSNQFDISIRDPYKITQMLREINSRDL